MNANQKNNVAFQKNDYGGSERYPQTRYSDKPKRNFQNLTDNLPTDLKPKFVTDNVKLKKDYHGYDNFEKCMPNNNYKEDMIERAEQINSINCDEISQFAKKNLC